MNIHYLDFCVLLLCFCLDECLGVFCLPPEIPLGELEDGLSLSCIIPLVTVLDVSSFNVEKVMIPNVNPIILYINTGMLNNR